MGSEKLKTYIVLITISIFWALGLLGCSNQNVSATKQPATSNSSLQPTGTVRSKPTVSYTAILTQTEISTMTMSPLPTLEPPQAKDALQELLMKQEPCRMPCFWGITPDQTALGQAQDYFSRFGLKLDHTLQKEGKDFYATDFGLKNGLSVSIVLRVQAEVVDSMRTDIGFVNYRSLSNHREWMAFAPETILAQYGQPSRVEFSISIPPCGSSPCMVAYTMIMYFDQSDLIIRYDSKPYQDDKIIRVCPLIEQYTGISVWLGKNADHAPAKQGISLEESTSLTGKQFFDLLLQSEPASACFDLSKDAIVKRP